MVNEDILNRKGARKPQDVPTEVRSLLNQGKITTVNLTEWLSINQIELIRNVFPVLGLESAVNELMNEIEKQSKPSTMKTIKLIGQTLYNYCLENNNLGSTVDLLCKHESDTIRCYATYLISLNTELSFSEKLDQSIHLISDKHFGVREIVWMAIRPEIENNLSDSIRILSTWTNHPDENVRRFTTEAIRPRGVWCKHLESLKENPEQALSVLEPLKSDESKYVQDSVGNWLNDASKTCPEFVIELCNKWEFDSPTIETKKIIKRALRSINKS